MRASPGDWIVVHGGAVGSADRRCLVLEVWGADGAPPYRVRWTSNDRVSVFIPGPDAVVVTEAQQHAADVEQDERLSAMQDAISAGRGRPVVAEGRRT